MNSKLALLAAARAAEEGCSEAEAARAIVVEARDVERVEGRPALLGYLVHTVLYGRAGGVGPGGWLGCLRRCFEAAGDSAPLLAAAVDALGSSALHYACHNLHTSGDRAEACAAVACLLAHGADATAANRWRQTALVKLRATAPSRTGGWAKGDGGDTSLASLVRLAERVGGREAVRRTLVDTPHVLTGAPGWDVVKSLPALRAIIVEASPLRVVIAEWGAARARRAADAPAVEGSGEYDVVSRLPRGALAVMLRQLAA